MDNVKMAADARVDTYPKGVATVFVFNLIFGSGALLLPYAFVNVGYILATILFFWLALLSFITCTYVVESMSLACAITAYTNDRIISTNKEKHEDLETTALTTLEDSTKLEEYTAGHNETMHLLEDEDDIFRIQTKYELSEMARLYFNRPLLIFFFVSTIIYLYGDLLIYLSIVGKSLKTITCHSGNLTVAGRFCERIGETNVFRIYISIFTALNGSLIFFNVSKTKCVQFSTICLRWLAFIVMISLALYKIAKGKAVIPDAVNFKGIPLFIGTGLYSFMCQHSLPSLVYPIRNTRQSYTSIFICAISAVLVIYMLITFSAAFAFDKSDIEKIYTMNFMNFGDGILFQILGYFLQLFPVIALSSSYPIVGITLRENIKALVFRDTSVNTKSKFFLKRVLVPALVVYPPYVAILFLSNNIDAIVNVVGSYAGTLVQYVIPSLLVLYAQKKAKSLFGASTYNKNFQKSPFGHIAVISLVLTWSVVGVCIVTYCNIQKLRNVE